MNRVALAVIGAGYGDEGKGLAVDALSHGLLQTNDDVVVVRSNGGAQAGHGVERPNGDRHVFHHIGSGAIAGASTHLSRFFVANPMMLGQEHRALQAWGANLRITIDPAAIVTTPWDVALNQAAESARSQGRHGSCGMGFGETIERHEKGFGLTIGDLSAGSRAGFDRFIDLMITKWIPGRAEKLGIPADDPLIRMVRENPNIREHFLDDLEAFFSIVSLMPDEHLRSHEAVIFEGAQGLELDMNLGDFPHVTRSWTGVRNMVKIAESAGIDSIRPHYMTRTYRTRHGAGPLPSEMDVSDMIKIVDRTNVDNDWQGSIRTAPLDPDRLGRIIRSDIDRAVGSGVSLHPVLGVTCIDQVLDHFPVMSEGVMRTSQVSDIAQLIGARAGLEVGMVSRGPSRENVTRLHHSGSEYALGP